MARHRHRRGRNIRFAVGQRGAGPARFHGGVPPWRSGRSQDPRLSNLGRGVGLPISQPHAGLLPTQWPRGARGAAQRPRNRSPHSAQRAGPPVRIGRRRSERSPVEHEVAANAETRQSRPSISRIVSVPSYRKSSTGLRAPCRPIRAANHPPPARSLARHDRLHRPTPTRPTTASRRAERDPSGGQQGLDRGISRMGDRPAKTSRARWPRSEICHPVPGSRSRAGLRQPPIHRAPGRSRHEGLSGRTGNCHYESQQGGKGGLGLLQITWAAGETDRKAGFAGGIAGARARSKKGGAVFGAEAFGGADFWQGPGLGKEV